DQPIVAGEAQRVVLAVVLDAQQPALAEQVVRRHRLHRRRRFVLPRFRNARVLPNLHAVSPLVVLGSAAARGRSPRAHRAARRARRAASPARAASAAPAAAPASGSGAAVSTSSAGRRTSSTAASNG